MVSNLKRVSFGAFFVLCAAFLCFIIWPEKAYTPHEVTPEFRAEALAFNIPALPGDWEDRKLTAADGTQIYWGQTGNREEAKATYIMVPGYTASMSMQGDQVAMLRARGYHVVGMDLRGQGRSERYRTEHPEKMWVDDFSIYADDVRLLVEELDLPNDLPVILSGSSFGGGVVTRAVGDFGLDVDGMFVLAPAYRPRTEPLSYSAVYGLAKLLRLLGKSNHFFVQQDVWKPYAKDLSQASNCSSYPARLNIGDALFVRDSAQRVGGATVQFSAEIIENGEIISAPDYAAKITLPITMIAAENDIAIDSTHTEGVCKNGFPNCKLVKIPGTGHCLTLENDTVLNAIWDEADALLARVGEYSGSE